MMVVVLIMVIVVMMVRTEDCKYVVIFLFYLVN